MKAPAVIIQLAMLLIVLFGSTQFVPEEQHGNVLAVAYGAGAIVLTILAALASLHAKSNVTKWLYPVLLLLAAASCVGLSVTAFLTYRWLAWLYFGSCALVTALLGAYLIHRYSRVTHGVFFSRPSDLRVTIVALGVLGAVSSYASTMYEWMLTAALHVFELQRGDDAACLDDIIIVELIALILGLWLQRNGNSMVKDSMIRAHDSGSVYGIVTVLSLVDGQSSVTSQARADRPWLCCPDLWW